MEFIGKVSLNYCHYRRHWWIRREWPQQRSHWRHNFENTMETTNKNTFSVSDIQEIKLNFPKDQSCFVWTDWLKLSATYNRPGRRSGGNAKSCSNGFKQFRNTCCLGKNLQKIFCDVCQTRFCTPLYWRRPWRGWILKCAAKY